MSRELNSGVAPTSPALAGFLGRLARPVCEWAAWSAAPCAPSQSLALVLLAPSPAMGAASLLECDFGLVSLLHVVRSGVGVILTSPSGWG